MTCKYCNAEMEDGVNLCPVCGKENLQEEQNEEIIAEEIAAEETVSEEAATEEAAAKETVTEKPKKEKKAKKAKGLSKNAKIALTAVGGVLAAGVLVCAILLLLGFRFRANDTQYKNKYTVSDSRASREADTVVAKVGDLELTNGELQMFYAVGIMEYLQANSGSLQSTFNLNYTEPLYNQTSFYDPDQTWEQFFIGMALDNWHQSAVLRVMGEAEGYEMSAEMQEQIDGLEENLAKLASENGYESAEAILKHDLGAGTNIAGYVQYYQDYYYGLEYFNEKIATLEPTEDEIIAYFADNEEMLKEEGITKNMGKAYDVRHILIEVGKTADEDGFEATTEADWAKCLADAQKLLDEWKKGEATEESFAELAKEHSADGGSASSGGLYAGLTASTNFVQEFKDWYMDENRKVGDTGLVKSTYGYHIMYFSASEELWITELENYILTERTIDMVRKAKEQYPIDVTYRKIILGEMTF